MIEIVSHPVALIGGGYVMCYGAAKFINRIQSRSVEKKQSLSKASAEELELWHSLWTHPDVSVTFYQWSEEDGFVERPLDIVVKLLLDWDNRTPSDRYAFQSKISSRLPRDQVWGPRTYRAVIDYGIWNAVELMDTVSKARAEAKRREAEKLADVVMRREALRTAERRIKIAWVESGKCRVCAGPRHGFSEDHCSTCWYEKFNAYSTKRQSYLKGLPSEHPKRVATDDYSAPLLRGRLRIDASSGQLVCNGEGAHVWYGNSEDGFVCDCGKRRPSVDKSPFELSSLKRRAKKLRLDIINASNAGMRMRLLRRYKELMEEIERYS